MQRKPKAPVEEKPPSVAMVVLISLFGYPGAGHLMVGKKKLGAIIAALFTAATIAIVAEIAYLLPSLLAFIKGDALTITHMPNWPRMGLWVALTALLWVGAAVDSGFAAKQYARLFPAPGPAPPAASDSGSASL